MNIAGPETAAAITVRVFSLVVVMIVVVVVVVVVAGVGVGVGVAMVVVIVVVVAVMVVVAAIDAGRNATATCERLAFLFPASVGSCTMFEDLPVRRQVISDGF